MIRKSKKQFLVLLMSATLIGSNISLAYATEATDAKAAAADTAAPSDSGTDTSGTENPASESTGNNSASESSFHTGGIRTGTIRTGFIRRHCAGAVRTVHRCVRSVHGKQCARQHGKAGHGTKYRYE